MKCIACGREMLDRKTHYECSNVVCDCEEEIEDREYWHYRCEGDAVGEERGTVCQ